MDDDLCPVVDVGSRGLDLPAPRLQLVGVPPADDARSGVRLETCGWVGRPWLDLGMDLRIEARASLAIAGE
jgi:hypothetical protein